MYYETPQGKAQRGNLRILLICALGLFICSIYLTIETAIKDNNYWNYAYAICLGIFAIIFFCSYIRVRLQKINNYVVNNKLKL